MSSDSKILHYHAGLDEAGLGPILGPYSAGLCLFSNSAEQELYEVLSKIISKDPADGYLAVGDSKAIYNPQKGLKELEKTLMAFYGQLYALPETLLDWFNQVAPDWAPQLKESPWFSDLADQPFPYLHEKNELRKSSEGLKEQMTAADVTIQGLALAIVPAPQWNQALERYKNKARVCQSILTPLIEGARELSPLKLRVDRQGGRKFYGEWLLEIGPGSKILALEESAEKSLYQWDQGEAVFQVKGDSLYLETALASMLAKYSRELLMDRFNAYWQKRYPKLKRTAGYYKDGKRFIKDLQSLGAQKDILQKMERVK